MHTPSSSGATVNHGGQNITTASSEFHVYTMEWNSERITFSVDGNTHYTYNPLVKDASTWPFDAPQYVLLNFAIQPAIAASFTEDAMEVDFVRIYQTSPELFCQGDIDNNGAIDIIDLGLLLGDFGCSDFDCVADLNNDGSTNLGDISIFLIVFGALCD
jgi:beta-glucanase (GH16 family)